MASTISGRRLLNRRTLVGAFGVAGAALSLSHSQFRPALAWQHGHAAGKSDPWLTVNPADGGVYLSWIGPEPGDADHSATPGAATDHAAPAANRVYLARSDDQGATFGEPVLVSGEDAHVSIGATPATVGFGPDGAIYVAYLSATPSDVSEWGREIVMVARSDDGVSFAPAVEVPRDEGIINAGGYHDLIVDGAGRVFVALLDFRDTFNLGTGDFSSASLRVAWSDDRAETFGPSVEVRKPACPCCPPTFHLAESGRLSVAFRDQLPQADGTDPMRDPMVAWSDDRGETWSAPVLVHRDGWQTPQCPHSGPGFGIDAGGRVHVAWYTGVEGRNGVYYAVADGDDLTFSAPVPLLADEWVPVTTVRMALDADGNAYVAYVDGREEPVALVVTKISPDGTQERVSPADLSGTYPTVAVTGADLALAYVAGDDVESGLVPLAVAEG